MTLKEEAFVKAISTVDPMNAGSVNFGNNGIGGGGGGGYPGQGNFNANMSLSGSYNSMNQMSMSMSNSHMNLNLQQHNNPTLPPNWVQRTDPQTGRTYYVNLATNNAQWDFPAF